MEKNEIKKALYKQKPVAKLQMIRKGLAYYSATIEVNEKVDTEVQFEVPVNDMGDADFFPEMDAKLLNRYLV